MVLWDGGDHGDLGWAIFTSHQVLYLFILPLCLTADLLHLFVCDT